MAIPIKIRHHAAVPITGPQVGMVCPSATDSASAGLAAPISLVKFQGIISTNQGAIPAKMKEPKIMSSGTPIASPRPLERMLNMTVRVRKNKLFNKRTPNIAAYSGMDKVFPVANKMSR